jgi:hypothetical protein
MVGERASLPPADGMTTAERIVAEAGRESPLWAAAGRTEPDWEPIFSALAPEQFALGLETVYEAYLVHYGRSRLFDPDGEGERVLLGDYLYAHGLVRIAEEGGCRRRRDDGRADLALRGAAGGERARRR